MSPSPTTEQLPVANEPMTTIDEKGSRKGDAQPEERLSFGSVFASAELEKQYRQSQLVGNRAAAKWCIIATIIASGLFISSDYRLLDWSSQFFVLLGLRTLTIAISLVALFWLRRTPAPISFNAILWAWAMIVSVGTAYINSTRPGAYTGHIIITVEMVLLTYCVLPLPLVLQILTAMVNTIAGPILHHLADPSGSGMTQSAVVQAYFIANLLGIITSIQLHRRKRQLFAAAMRQTELTANLERALAEIRTLRGILPICAHCKRVRDDSGVWEQVEVYVRKHTHAEFTHDICPECAKEHFGKYADD